MIFRDVRFNLETVLSGPHTIQANIHEWTVIYETAPVYYTRANETTRDLLSQERDACFCWLINKGVTVSAMNDTMSETTEHEPAGLVAKRMFCSALSMLR